MNILHLSDMTLSGAPIRIVDLFNKYTEHKARHIVWEPTTGFRKFKIDLVGPDMTVDEIKDMWDWADVIHYHNRFKSLKIFEYKIARKKLPYRREIIQIHSPRDTVMNHENVLEDKLPLAIVAQYQVRQWPGAQYVVPNVVDIFDPIHMPAKFGKSGLPVVSYAPSNWNAKGWDDKSYGTIAPVLKRLSLDKKLVQQVIVQQAHQEVLQMKRHADIGIDEVATGSYHLSSLEYLTLGVPCFANIDEQTEEVLKELTGADELPWIKATKENFQRELLALLEAGNWRELGQASRYWMEQYWAPEKLIKHYLEMYEDLA